MITSASADIETLPPIVLCMILNIFILYHWVYRKVIYS
jgi:hypothetical protein